jgi:hypothetical protein
MSPNANAMTLPGTRMKQPTRDALENISLSCGGGIEGYDRGIADCELSRREKPANYTG